MNPKRISAGDYPLDWVKAQLTRLCNLSCSFCSQADSSARTTLDAGRLIRQLLALVEVRLLILTGGEPLVVPDALVELLDYCSSRGTETGIFTNATLASPSLVDRLARAGLTWARVTVNGSCAEVHEQSYPRGSFPKTVAGLRAFRERGVTVKARATISRANVSDVSALVAFLAGSGCSELDLRPYLPLGDCNPHEQFMLSPEELLRVGGQVCGLRAIYPEIKLKLLPGWFDFVASGAGTSSQLEVCACARRYLYINAEADILPCPGHRAKVGTLEDGLDLAQLWASSPLLNKMRFYRQADFCLKCPVRAQCHRSSCALLTYEAHGTFDGEINSLCPIYPLSPQDPVAGLEKARAIFEAARATARSVDRSQPAAGETATSALAKVPAESPQGCGQGSSKGVGSSQ